MEWLDRHHVAVVRTATGVVLCASAVTGVIGSMTFHDLARDNAAKQAQIDALAHQLQQQAPSAIQSSPAQAGPTSGTKVASKPGSTPSPGPTVLLLANSHDAPVVPVQQGTQGGTTAVPLGSSSGGHPGTGATPPAGGGHTPKPHPTPGKPTPSPTPTPTPTTTEGPVSSLVDVASGTLKKIVAPLDPKPQPSQKPLAVLYLIPVVRRNS